VARNRSIRCGVHTLLPRQTFISVLTWRRRQLRAGIVRRLVNVFPPLNLHDMACLRGTARTQSRLKRESRR